MKKANNNYNIQETFQYFKAIILVVFYEVLQIFLIFYKKIIIFSTYIKPLNTPIRKDIKYFS